MRGCVTEIARELGMNCSHEYYTVDAILYNERDDGNFRNPRCAYAKYISVAIEIENNCTDAHVEMNKLQLLNAPLTVLIT